MLARLRVRARERRLHVGNLGWLVRARPCTEGEGHVARAAGFHRAWSDFNQRDVARACRKRVCCVTSLSRERESGGALAFAHT